MTTIVYVLFVTAFFTLPGEQTPNQHHMEKAIAVFDNANLAIAKEECATEMIRISREMTLSYPDAPADVVISCQTRERKH